MSHLKHINEFKKELITAGVLEPEVQIALVRAAYVAAFIRLIECHRIPEADQKDVLFHILNYWNDIFPVNGNIVYGQVKSFYTRLSAEISKGGNVFVQLVTDEAVTEHPTYSEMPSYAELVQTLYGEAEHKYKKAKSI